MQVARATARDSVRHRPGPRRRRIQAPRVPFKQLLRYGDATLLDHVLATARECGFDQLLCVIGGSATEIRERVHLSDATVVENQSFGEGCSSSIAAALTVVDDESEVLVLMLGDQPGVTAETIRTLLKETPNDAALAVCAYQDGRGHPLAFARAMFGELATLHGDKGVWKLLDRHAAMSSTCRSPARSPATSTPTRTIAPCCPSWRKPGVVSRFSG